MQHSSLKRLIAKVKEVTLIRVPIWRMDEEEEVPSDTAMIVDVSRRMASILETRRSKSMQMISQMESEKNRIVSDTNIFDLQLRLTPGDKFRLEVWIRTLWFSVQTYRIVTPTD